MGEKKFLGLGISTVLIIMFALPIIIAATANIVTQNGNTNFGTVNEDVSHLYNFTINITDIGTAANVTQINITLPYGFTFNNGTNLTLGTSIGARNITFSNTSTVLTWQNTTWYVLNGSSNLSSFIFNATASTPGAFNFTITLTNATATANYQFNVSINDTTDPTVTTSVSSSTTSSLVLDIAVTENLNTSSITCVSDRDGTHNTAIGSANTSAQTLTETSLNCGTSYTYIVTCTDANGNAGASSALIAYTANCSDGGSSTTSGGSSSSTTMMTYSPQKSDLETGYTKQLKANERVKIQVGNTYHHMTVKTIGTSSATIEIASDPIVVDLDVGEDAKVDVDKNGTYDIYVKLNSITNGKADVTVMTISEAVPEGASSVSTTGGIAGENEEEQQPSESDLTWLWIILGVVLILAIIGTSMKRR